MRETDRHREVGEIDREGKGENVGSREKERTRANDESERMGKGKKERSK